MQRGRGSGVERRRGVQERGYQDCTFADQPPGHIQTECPVCKNLLRDPTQVACCGNLMCSPCFNKISGSCPICRKTLKEGFPDRNHKRIVEGFRVHCCYWQEDGSGCQWVGELGALENHLNASPTATTRLTGCSYVPVKCGFCHEKVIRSNLDQHEKTICQKRRTKCQYCDYVSTFEDVTGAHRQICPHIPIDCKYCGNKIKKSEMDSHVARNCQLYPTACEYEWFGCSNKIARRDMAGHMANQQSTHLRLVKERVQRNEGLLLIALILLAIFVILCAYQLLFAA